MQQSSRGYGEGAGDSITFKPTRNVSEENTTHMIFAGYSESTYTTVVQNRDHIQE